MAQKDLKSRTITSLFWKLFEQGGSAVIQIVVQVVMARLLSPTQFGSLAIMLVFVNVGNVIVQSGLNTAIIQAPDISRDDYDTVFWMSLVVSAALCALVFFAAPAVVGFYRMPDMLWPLRVLVLVLVINAFNAIQEAIVARNLEFHKTFRSTVSAAATSGVLGIGCALMGGGLWALVVQQLSYQLTKCAVLAAQIPWKPRAVFVPHRARRLFGFGWKLLASGLLDQANQSVSDLVIGRVFTGSQLGLVSQGKKYPQQLGTLLDSVIQPVMLSAVSRVQGDVALVRRLMRRALKTSTFFVVPAMTGFALVAPRLVPALLGAQWGPAVPYLQLYCLAYALLPIHTTNLQVLNGMGRSDVFLRLEVVKVVVGLGILLVAAFGLRSIDAIVVGAALSNVFCTFINAFPNKRIVGYSYLHQLRDIAPAFGLAAAAALCATPLGALALGPWVTILAQLVTFSAAYLLLAAALRVEELSYLVRTAREALGAPRGQGGR
ncbi:lipopolysaccharide biosynthesis protein [Olsenella sp. HMSC062G07]|uniref:lipopolysaccharide biosynthesis protein n=1 Tax=Olsenella sp. HMSC062G07 TaxID=1739330 RepID=UPI0008A21285|nr:lipopolysaccharide biosynthesis protein [Olsenella sp. HMSC062G07]OFK22182.1 hypothetical protein HMPREF2826_02485 [Olsenella sp. HMSC062G07]